MDRREALKRTAAITGLAVTSSAGLGLLSGCEPTRELDWKPQFLTDKEVKLVSAICDMIIPKTDTPGALELSVPEFVDIMLKDNYKGEDQQTVKHGLTTFEEEVYEEYGYFFYECGNAEKKEIMGALEERSYKHQDDKGEKNFYLILKELTLLGFFTSEFAMKNLLNYSPVPGRYDGCIDIGPDEKVFVNDNV